MYKELIGKKLLILGATPSEISLVKRAQKFGVYVVVTDYNTVEVGIHAPAKLVADEAWDISWSDIDELEKKCIENDIDGITAGYSEIRVDCLIRLCKRLNLPCYITDEQLEITRDKIKFKNECRKYGLNVVKDYADIDSVDHFPVIVKPVDRAGSIGISIASNKNELINSYKYAMEMSICKQVIIEDLIDDCDKVDFYYAINKGKIELITSCDTINAKNNNNERVVQSCWLYPERHLEFAKQKVDATMRKMIAGMGIRYGCIFFSGFVNAEKEFVFFECGFRLEGGHQYEYSYHRGLMNFLDIFILHSLLGNTSMLKYNGACNSNLKCVTINLYAKKGTLTEIAGVDEVRQNGCSLVLIYARIGQKCDTYKAILSKLGMFSFCDESPQRLKEKVDNAYSVLKFIDENGNDMVYDKIDTNTILNWWNK